MRSVKEAVVLLHGGVGNQLFQYAAALDLVSDSDPQRVRVFSYGNEWGPDHPDIQRLAGVRIEYPTRVQRSLYPGIAVRETWKDDVSRILAKLWAHAASSVFVDQSDPFSPRSVSSANTVVLSGFFQNPDWWQNSWRHVAHMIEEHRPEGVDDLRSSGRTAIKVRRSDYVGRGICLPMSYYLEAMARVGIVECDVTVVCEDLDFFEYFGSAIRKFGCRPLRPEVITGDPHIDDFWNLAAAKRQVVANSSYSWWAAAVAGQAMDGTQVAYPRPWLPNAWSRGPLPDLGLQSWIDVQSTFE
jgi:hypothetical protein